MSGQKFIDFLASTGRGCQDSEKCFSIRSAFPTMGDLNKTVLLFKIINDNLQNILAVARLYAKTRSPRINKNFVTVHFLNEKVASNAQKFAEKQGITCCDPPIPQKFGNMDLSLIKEGVLKKEPGNDFFLYGRNKDIVYILFRQGGEEFGEYDVMFRILSVSAKAGEILNEEIMQGPLLPNGTHEHLTCARIARRILEKRVGIKRKISVMKPEIKTPHTVESCFSC